MQTVFPPAAPVLLPIAGSPLAFPVRRVYCVGRNYAAHAREMGQDPTREPPFFFQKNPDNCLLEGTAFPYPGHSQDVQFEVELVVALKDGGSDISVADANSKIFGYAIGIDFTRRDLQADAKKAGKPWAAAKAFEASAPIGPIVAAETLALDPKARIWLSQNGTLRQEGHLEDMTWTVPEVIAELSKLFRLAPGDLIMTGTPAGVGPVARGDVIACGIDGLPDFTVTVA
ncbi:5-carboxymethyl-2-hydroxymuconate isomerase [Xaviernesmea oryzae]|uniref:5-carboxymethyl-2-hydroxymuconate isomerase n=1 Tax=Xaviernesmea oryzae TaxID=464029 RepID=A0A1Q9B0F3_9HYPH|nr:fumarylacetoacetate hydrolase family protein [Xaviernesmea oryzae]OLP61468.1 5-carboxymethyl-2-hydroxymuconate isomerase [Xaviernesmea oryzae]SEL68380.1 fumarylpyruvate hydrolase [Xaviernesmea oryzae]